MRRIVITLACVLTAATAFAQSRPLVTEDAETIGAGRILIEGGLDLEKDVLYPVSGLEGNRLAVPTFGVSVGLSSFAEFQVDGGLYQGLNITERRAAPLSSVLDIDGDRTSDIQDFVFATKIRVLTETAGRPAVAVRFATKLPNASNENGLGTDMIDVYATLLVAKTIQSIRVVGNGGVAIQGDPTSAVPEQNDLLIFGASVARAITSAAEIVGEINGRLNFAETVDPGAENRGVVRVGARYTRGTVRVDGAILLGMTSRDPQFGLTTGFTWVFDAFRTP